MISQLTVNWNVEKKYWQYYFLFLFKSPCDTRETYYRLILDVVNL